MARVGLVKRGHQPLECKVCKMGSDFNLERDGKWIAAICQHCGCVYHFVPGSVQ